MTWFRPWIVISRFTYEFRCLHFIFYPQALCWLYGCKCLFFLHYACPNNIDTGLCQRQNIHTVVYSMLLYIQQELSILWLLVLKAMMIKFEVTNNWCRHCTMEKITLIIYLNESTHANCVNVLQYLTPISLLSLCMDKYYIGLIYTYKMLHFHIKTIILFKNKWKTYWWKWVMIVSSSRNWIPLNSALEAQV